MATGNDIEVIGASENNLKNVSVTVPKGRLVVFCGVSGSGKSSLAFDTIARESQRAWQESYPLFLRNKMPHYERPARTQRRGPGCGEWQADVCRQCKPQDNVINM